MSRHLRPQDFVDALDGRLAADREQHVGRCPECQAELSELRAITCAASETPVPEPSPLFWDHFSARVRTATSAIEPRPTLSWIRWQSVAALACLVVAVVIAVGQTNHGPGQRRGPAGGHNPAAFDLTAASDDESLNFMARVAAALPADDLQQVTGPSDDAADAVLEQLAPEQRTELVRLLATRMQGGQ